MTTQYDSHIQHIQGKWWYPWDGTLNNQPHTHLTPRGYLLGPISPFKGLQQAGSVKLTAQHPPSPGKADVGSQTSTASSADQV